MQDDAYLLSLVSISVLINVCILCSGANCNEDTTQCGCRMPQNDGVFRTPSLSFYECSKSEITITVVHMLEFSPVLQYEHTIRALYECPFALKPILVSERQVRTGRVKRHLGGTEVILRSTECKFPIDLNLRDMCADYI